MSAPCRTCGGVLSTQLAQTYGLPRDVCIFCAPAYDAGHDDGYAAAVRDLWRGALLGEAAKIDAYATKLQAIARKKYRDAQRNKPMDYVYQDPCDLLVEGVMCRNQVACTRAYEAARAAAAEASQLRAWAKEGA